MSYQTGCFSQNYHKTMTDAQYLLSIRPDSTPDQLWKFCERVAICMLDGGLDEDLARATALNWL